VTTAFVLDTTRDIFQAEHEGYVAEMTMLDSLLERAYWISQITLPLIAVGAAWIAIKQVRSIRLFELMKHIEDPRVREAREIVMMQVPKWKGKDWWTDDQLREAATTLASAYDHLGSLLHFEGMGRVGRFFVDRWGEGIVRTHIALDDYLTYRRRYAPQSYIGFTWLYQHAKRRHPNVQLPPT
jgi:hypothetical protein